MNLKRPSNQIPPKNFVMINLLCNTSPLRSDRVTEQPCHLRLSLPKALRYHLQEWLPLMRHMQAFLMVEYIAGKMISITKLLVVLAWLLATAWLDDWVADPVMRLRNGIDEGLLFLVRPGECNQSFNRRIQDVLVDPICNQALGTLLTNCSVCSEWPSKTTLRMGHLART